MTGTTPAPRRLAIAGGLTIYQAAAVKAQLLAALAEGGELELDLAQVEEIDSAGLQLLILAKREAQRRGLPLRLAAHSTPVREALEFCALVGYFGDPLHIPAHA